MLPITDLIRVGGSVCGFIGILLSLGLIFWPQQLMKLDRALNKQISTDKLRLMLEREFDITSMIMEVRILAGVITLLLSCILVVIAIRL
jgi:hypothetical protein